MENVAMSIGRRPLMSDSGCQSIRNEDTKESIEE